MNHGTSIMIFLVGCLAVGSLFLAPQSQEQRWLQEVEERCKAVEGGTE